ncbi:MAG: cell division protein FtsK [Legionellales bacterium]|nr:cell division protein FtsK [Legionellales bacterium]
MIIIAALALFLVMSLVSYNPRDPGWSRAGLSQHVVNAGGQAGAWLADFMLYWLGYFAYLFPIMLAYAAWTGYHAIKHDKPRRLFILGLIGFILILFTGVGLSSLYLPPSAAHLPFTSGGILGNLMGHRLSTYLNRSGATVVLVAGMLCGITLMTGLSWLNSSRVIAAFSFYVAQKTRALLTLLLQKIKNRKTETDEPEIEAKIEHFTPIKMKPELLPVAEPPVKLIKPAKPLSEPSDEKRNLPVAKIAINNTNAKLEKIEKETIVPSFATAMQTGLPTFDLLNIKPKSQEKGFTNEYLEARSREVEQRLAEFGVEVHVIEVHPGPVVTRYEMELAPGVKVSKISNLAKDLARSLLTPSVRIVEVIPGKSLVGVELPNPHREMVFMREVLESAQYQEAHSMLSMVLGKDIAGNPVVVDLAKMPHLLVAGTTGAGKSVGLNVMLLSLLFKATPEDVRLIMVDPKMLELSIYEGIPHLLAPVVTDMKQAANALRWCVAEMDRRYQLMASLGVRNLAGYNAKISEAAARGESVLNPLLPPIPGQEPRILERLPSIVVLIDEFADMIMVVGKKVEELIARIAQKARAAGIHLILATQRPSVDVITGLIKANIPTRIAFQVSSKIDSRTILDQQGAEQLLGHGDMLYMPPGSGVPIRVHGAFVADQEVHNVVAELKKLGAPNYLREIVESSNDSQDGNGSTSFEDAEGEQDPLYDEAVDFVVQSRRISISSLQRRFKIGYNRSARIVEDMERSGVVSSMDHGGAREVIAPAIQQED